MNKVCALLLVICLPFISKLSFASEFELSSSILDVQSENTYGGIQERAAMQEFFEVQKAIVYSTLRDIGIRLDELPESIRNKLASYHTTNFEAFSLFSDGIVAQDEGRYAKAKRLFSQAAKLDPGFDLAREMGSAMPELNTTSEVTLGAVLANVSRAATSDAKDMVEVDVEGAVNALSAGLDVVVGEKVVAVTENATDSNFTSNEDGSSEDFVRQRIVGFNFTRSNDVDVAIAATSVFESAQLAFVNGGDLESIELSEGLNAERNSASHQQLGRVSLGDGSEAYWGNWLSDEGEFSIASNGERFDDLGNEFQYMIGDATPQMPTSGQVTYSPRGGFLEDVSGTLSVDFVDREVSINDLGFSMSGRSYSSLNGAAQYSDNQDAAGFFNGNYTSGVCEGCTAFSVENSSFTGSFSGKDAEGVIFSTIMTHGAGTDAGSHLFTNED